MSLSNGKLTFTALPAGRDGNRLLVSVFVAPKLTARGDDTADPLANWPARARQLRFRIRVARLRSGTFAVDPVTLTSVGEAVLKSSDLEIGESIYPVLFAGASVRPIAELRRDGVTFKTYDAKGVSICIRDVMRTFYNAAKPVASAGQSMDVALMQQLATIAEQFAALARQSAPLAQEQATLPPTIPEVVDLDETLRQHVPVHPSPLPRIPQLATAQNAAPDPFVDRDARRVWANTNELNDRTREDLQLNVARQRDPAAYRQRVRAAQQTGQAAPVAMNPLLALRTFWSRAHRHAGVPPSTPRQKPTYDFHQLWAASAHYARLLPRIGITLRLSIADANVFAVNDAIAIELMDGAPISPLVPEYAWVAYKHDTFLPRAYDNKVVDGFLNLNDDEFALEDLDLDRSGHNLLQSLEVLFDKYKNAPTILARLSERDNDALPAPLRTSGLALVHSMRDAEVARGSQVAAREADMYPLFFAEDLVRGYVVDLFARDRQARPNPEWYRLCLRDEEFRVNDGLVFRETGVDGSIKPPTVEDHTDSQKTGGRERYLLETIAQWAGTHPCLTADSVNAIPSSIVVKPERQWPLRVTVSAPASVSQVPFRVGSEYRLRARVEFITGDIVQPDAPYRPNGVTADAPVLPSGGEWHKARRYEPLAAPAIVLPRSTSDGARNQQALERCQIVSREGGRITRDVEARLVVPPRVTQEVAELHVRRRRFWASTEGFRSLDLHQNGSLLEVAGPFRSSAGAAYLPDPLVEEVRIFFDDLAANTRYPQSAPIVLPLYARSSDAIPHRDWPDGAVHVIELAAAPLGAAPRLELIHGGPGYQGIDARSRRVRLSLPPGHFGEVRMVAGWGANGNDRLDLMALWHEQTADEAEKRTVLTWNHPLLGARRDVHVAHAVQVPLLPLEPILPKPSSATGTTRLRAKMALERPSGANAYDALCTFALDRKSTGWLNVSLHWREARDQGTDGPIVQDGAQTLFSIAVPSNRDDQYQHPNVHDVALHADFHDQRFRRVRFRLKGVSRFIREIGKPEPECSRVDTTDFIDVPSTRQPDAPDVAYLAPSHRYVNNASAREVRQFESSRHGAAIRVYLNGTWLSSGAGELLGVVIHQTDEVRTALRSGAAAIPFEVPPSVDANTYLSAWGLDPRVPAPASAGKLSFIGWDTRASDAVRDGQYPAPLAERLDVNEPDGACGWDVELDVGRVGPRPRVGIVGYRPAFDTARKRWYADVLFDRAPAYGTFVRLVLVRYQPGARERLELSPVVIADFAPLAVDRTLTVQRRKVTCDSARARDGIAIAVWGIPSPLPVAGQPSLRPNQYVITLERKGFSKTSSLKWEAAVVVQPRMAPADIVSSAVNRGELLWYGEVQRQDCVDRVLVIREFEVFESDHAGTTSTGSFEDAKCLFYADALEL